LRGAISLRQVNRACSEWEAEPHELDASLANPFQGPEFLPKLANEMSRLYLRLSEGLFQDCLSAAQIVAQVC
jgi:hypothetical protein